jgi:hypothetical protein
MTAKLLTMKQSVERKARAQMYEAFRLYERAEADPWHGQAPFWKQEADRLAQSAEGKFRVARQ